MNVPQMRAPAHASLGLILLLGSLTAFGAVAIDLYLPAMPAIAVALKTSPGEVQASMSAFFIGMGAGQLVYGPLSDRLGRRPPLLFGAVLFTIASLGCAMAPDAHWLIVGRLFQALGACAGVVVARAVVRDRFDTTESARLFSLLMLVLGIAPMLAPAAGAVLLDLFGWRSIFWALTFFGLMMGFAVYFGLSESRSADTEKLARSESILQSYGAAFGHRKLVGLLLAGASNGGALFAYISGSPALFIDFFGLTPIQFSYIFAANAVALIGASQINRWLVLRHGPARIMRFGVQASLLMSALFLLAAVSGLATLPVAVVLIFASLAGYGFISANSMALALSTMPARAGAISALMGGASFLSGAVFAGIAVIMGGSGPLPMAICLFLGMFGSFLSLWLVAGVARWYG